MVIDIYNIWHFLSDLFGTSRTSSVLHWCYPNVQFICFFYISDDTVWQVFVRNCRADFILNISVECNSYFLVFSIFPVTFSSSFRILNIFAVYAFLKIVLANKTTVRTRAISYVLKISTLQSFSWKKRRFPSWFVYKSLIMHTIVLNRVIKYL